MPKLLRKNLASSGVGPSKGSKLIGGVGGANVYFVRRFCNKKDRCLLNEKNFLLKRYI